MAIISNFELLYKPIAPVAGPAAEVGRVAVQGYFLEISNLEDRDITLIFRTRTSVRDAAGGDSVNTELTDTNNIVAYDITADNEIDTVMTSAGEQIPGKQLGHYVACLFLPAGQTASLALLPDLSNLFTAPVADLAIRGYTEIILSSNIDSLNPLTFSDPESARILVSAEHRGTFIDPQFDPSDFSTQTGLDFDQSAYSLNTYNGKALQNINTHAPCNDPFQNLLTSNALDSEMMKSGSDLRSDRRFSISTKDMATNKKSKFSLSQLSKTLFKDANTPKRSVSIKVGMIPVKFDYFVKDGIYVVDEESTIKAINLFLKRKRLSKKAIDVKEIVKNINKALSGDKRADAFISKVLEEIGL